MGIMCDSDVYARSMYGDIQITFEWLRLHNWINGNIQKTSRCQHFNYMDVEDTR